MKLIPALLGLLAAGALAAAPAVDGYVRITAPVDGAIVESKKPVTLLYEVHPGPGGEHVHVYVDGKEVGILRQLTGSHTLRTLQPGRRALCVKVVNRAHVPTGVEQCVSVTVK